MFAELSAKVRRYFATNFAAGTLKLLIIVWCIAIIIAALLIDNPWVLAAIAAYEVLP